MPETLEKAKDAEKDDKKDEGGKPWEASKKKKGKVPPQFKKDEADDEDDEDGDEEDEDMDKAKKKAKKSGSFRADLSKAIELLARHSEENDPSLRREALLAKELRGGGLDKSERAELVSFLSDGPPEDGLGDRALREMVPSEKLGKALAANDGIRETHEALMRSLAVFADSLDKSQRDSEATSFLMARCLTAIGESVDGTMSALEERQSRLESEMQGYSRQPAHAPVSQGLRYAEKSFAGGAGSDPLDRTSKAKLTKALNAMAESEPKNSDLRSAYQTAALGLRINRPLMPLIADKVREHLADQDA